MTDDWGTPYPAPDEPKKKAKGRPLANVVAERIIGEHELFSDKTKTLFRYTGTHWVEVSDAEALNWAFQKSGGFEASNTDLRNAVLATLKAAKYDPAHRWGRCAPWEVPCRSGMIDARTGALRPHDPHDRLDRIIPWDYDAAAPRGPWLAALDAWFGAQDDLKEGLQEFFGYLLLNHCHYKRACIVFGPSNSAKSRIVVAAMNLVGPDAHCQLSFEDMEDPRRRGVIVGKALNVMTEVPAEAFIRQSVFNAIVSGEPLLIDDKFKLPFSYEPTAKHLVACEELPRITERGEGALNRMLLIPTTRVFPDGDPQRDPGLDAKLLAVMPGIFAWALEGARRLIEHDGQWVQPAAAAKALRKYREDQNPAVGFLEECFMESVGTATLLTHLLRQFHAWDRGSKRMNVKSFAAALRRHLESDPADRGRFVRKVKRKANGGQSLLCLVNYKFLGLPGRVELTVADKDAVSTAAEIEATGEVYMQGDERPE